MKPIIGINVDIVEGPPKQASIYTNYFNAVVKAGGIPVLLPPIPDEDLDELMTKLSGLLLIGGRDYNPELWGEAACPQVCQLSQDRQDFDLRLVQHAIAKADIPVLGICAGAQILNISMGGSLIQDIPQELPASSIKHSGPRPWFKELTWHKVNISPGSKLAGLYSDSTISVPTSHHQAVKKLGKGLKVAAHADDGIVEAIEMEGTPFAIGVQWHPERDYSTNSKLFTEFVSAAARSNSQAAARPFSRVPAHTS